MKNRSLTANTLALNSSEEFLSHEFLWEPAKTDGLSCEPSKHNEARASQRYSRRCLGASVARLGKRAQGGRRLPSTEF